MTSLLLVVLLAVVAHVDCLSPVVIVPGAAGSQIEVKLVDKPSKPAWYCYSSSDGWYTLWLRLASLLPFQINCWTDNMRLEWNMSDMSVGTPAGVYTRVPGFGSTSTMETLDTTGFVKYMKPLVEQLRGLGYKSGKNLFGAPYDFRYSPESIPWDFYSKLESLIVEAYEKNNSTKVSIVSHSYGGVVTQYFLSSLQKKQWKDKYIQQWISLAGVFGGSKEELLLYSSGHAEGIPKVVVHGNQLRKEQRSSTGNLWMFSSLSQWCKDEVLVKTRKRTYNVSNLDEYLADIGFPQGTVMRKHINNASSLYSKGPEVHTHCLYGDIPESTVEKLEFDGDFPDEPSKVIMGSGDGTVNRGSLKLCDRFSTLQEEPVNVVEFKGVSHSDVVGNTKVFQEIKKLL